MAAEKNDPCLAYVKFSGSFDSEKQANDALAALSEVLSPSSTSTLTSDEGKRFKTTMTCGGSKFCLAKRIVHMTQPAGMVMESKVSGFCPYFNIEY